MLSHAAAKRGGDGWRRGEEGFIVLCGFYGKGRVRGVRSGGLDVSIAFIHSTNGIMAD